VHQLANGEFCLGDVDDFSHIFPHRQGLSDFSPDR
jgi:hypothetical protein